MQTVSVMICCVSCLSQLGMSPMITCQFNEVLKGLERPEEFLSGTAGTHDNETTVGWWKDSAQAAEKDYIKRYLHTDGKDIAGDFMRESFKSVSKTAIVMLQVALALLVIALAYRPMKPENAMICQQEETAIHDTSLCAMFCLCIPCL